MKLQEVYSRTTPNMAYGKPEINEFTIKCEECNKHYKKLTHAHLFKLHSLTISQYKEKHGFCSTQPLEAFYVESIRQHYNKKYNATKYLSSKFQFKKGAKRTSKRSQQELYRLQKYNERKKGSFLFLSPAEVTAVCDLHYKLHYKLHYSFQRIAFLFRLNTKTVVSMLKRKDIYLHWKSYYKKD